MKLISCGSSLYGLCASTEANPSNSIGKYLSNDLYWVGGTCVSCPNGWSSLNGRCFKMFNGPLSQADAQNDCKSKNSTLANANTNDKYSLVKSLTDTSASYVNIFLFIYLINIWGTLISCLIRTSNSLGKREY